LINGSRKNQVSNFNVCSTVGLRLRANVLFTQQLNIVWHHIL